MAAAGGLAAILPAAPWGCSSAGRAPRSHRGGQGFESPHLHHSIRVSEPCCHRSLIIERMRPRIAERVHRGLSTPTYLKVPELTLLFWVIKLLSTAMGESTSDYLVFHINPYVAVVVGCDGLVVALVIQFWVPRYIAWAYWLAVVMVAVFGTMAADVLHVVLRIPYAVTSLAFAASLAVIFVAWYQIERTLSIHSIDT